MRLGKAVWLAPSGGQHSFVSSTKPWRPTPSRASGCQSATTGARTSRSIWNPRPADARAVFSSPRDTKVEISCSVKPRSHAVSARLNRAGRFVRFKKWSFSGFIVGALAASVGGSATFRVSRKARTIIIFIGLFTDSARGSSADRSGRTVSRTVGKHDIFLSENKAILPGLSLASSLRKCEVRILSHFSEMSQSGPWDRFK